MFFLNPIFLIGVLGASIPVVIHLYNRKRTVTYKFAAIDFIMESQKQIIGGAKLRQILLLILRSLLIAFLAVSIAKPYIDNKLSSVVGSSNAAPSSNVLILDNSFSMNNRINGKSIFVNAKEAAIRLLDSLNLMDEVSIIFTSSASSKLPSLSVDKDMAIDTIKESKISYSTTKIYQSLESAIDILNSTNTETKRIFLFTDLTQNGWIANNRNLLQEGRKGRDKDNNLHKKTDVQKNKISSNIKIDELSHSSVADMSSGFRLPDSLAHSIRNLRPQINVIDVSKSDILNNICITKVDIDEHPSFTAGAFNIKLTISNFSSLKMEKIAARLYINKEMYAQGFVHLGPWSSATKVFYFKTDIHGLITGRAEISESGQNKGSYLSVDNVRYFVINNKKIVNALIVDGDPSANIFRNESFYLEKVLSSGVKRSSNIKPFVCNLSKFEDKDLNLFDMIILCNVESMSSKKVNELEGFAANGGAILFTLGNKVEAAYYNKALRNLLPCSLRSIKSFNSKAGLKTTDLSMKRPISRFNNIYLKRPESGSIFFDIFSDLNEGDISSVNFHTVFIIDNELPSAEGPSQGVLKANEDKGSIILRYSNDLPAIVVKEYGQGQIALFTSTIDRDWNNLPIKTVFLPIIHQICKSMTATSVVEGYNADILVDDKWNLPGSYLKSLAGMKKETATIMLPGGSTETLFLNSLSKSGKMSFVNTRRPGIYKLYGDENLLNARGVPFAVNVDTIKESNLKKIENDQIESLFGNDIVKVVSGVKNNSDFYRRSTKQNLWGFALILVLCLMCAEAFFSRR